MLLEERRSVIKHLLLNIITLGLYGLYVTADLARDTNVSCHGDGRYSRFGTKEMVLSILTLGIYQLIWMLKLIDRWNAFSVSTKKGIYVRPVFYIIFRLTVIGAPIAIMDIYRMIGRLCEDFNDEFFRLDENDTFAKKAKAIIEEVAEKRADNAESKVAGYKIIEEYDPNADRRRVDHSAEEAARAALLAELEEEERLEVVQRLADEAAAEAKAEEERELAARNAHRNKPWFRKVFLVLLAVFLLPMIATLIITMLPSVYEDTFVGELGEKYDRLNEIDDPKIVVIGGSSVAFGLDSEMVKEHLGMEVVNFGLYANLGTKLMIDLSKTNINEGDIIVIAPEMNSQTLSLYFNAETAIQALDGNWGMLKNVDTDDYESLIGAMWQFAGEKLEYIVTGKRPENVGAYQKVWFNEYGDNTFDRPYNTMMSTAKNIKLDFRVNKQDSINSDYEKFIDYVNDYVAYCSRKGATVYFSFAPMNAAAMTEYNNSENIYNFYKNLCASLDCRVISDVNQYIMDEGYFFDSEFHLNNAGVTVRTAQLIDDIKREKGEVSLTLSKSEIPEPPGYKPIDVVIGDEENLHFNLELVESNGKEVYTVVGLNDEGIIQKTLKIPTSIDGIPVVIVKANAFAGSMVETLYLGENIAVLDAGAFGGAMSLKSVYLPMSKDEPGKVSVPNSMDPAGLATMGANEALKIYVNAEALEAFKADYFWDAYSKRIEPYTEEAK
ncbi:MAG: DUF4234 domain-containing protein [Clostridia bacterium]|nr:DUF4234 domain-containing protein [Clostridia bacterium]